MVSLGFARATDQDVFRTDTLQPNTAPSIAITGQEARQFYENLLKDDKEKDDGTKTHKPLRRKRTTTRRELRRERGGREGIRGEAERGEGERREELQGLRLLRYAHEGDTSAIKELLSKGADINFQDSYMWTGLMCSCWAGHRAAVRLLLQTGAAWVGVVDLQGRDARDLALQAGHTDVVKELDSFGRTQSKVTKPAQSSPCQRCEVCSTSYSGPTPSHLSSTLHQFNLHRPPPAPHYCLPPSSASYRMMLRCGWAPGSGLGPEGTGARGPVPTVLKRDTQGLGFGRRDKPKVTHFKARDTGAVSQRRRDRSEERETEEGGAERSGLGERL